MIFASGLGIVGIVLSLVFGCLLLALIAELYYLLWWKKLRVTTAPVEDDYAASHAKELFYLFCWNKPPIPPPTTAGRRESAPGNAEALDIELGSSKEFLLRTTGGEQDAMVEAELMRIHNRFLFTIKEETKEDLESEDGRSKASRKGSRTRSLSDLFISPMPSPPLTATPKDSTLSNLDRYSPHGFKFNPLFESSSGLEAEINRLRTSPPPSFKFLRDAEEKLYRRLLEEAEKVNKGGAFEEGEGKEASLIRVVVGKNSNNHHSSCSQVLPLSSSPTSKPVGVDQISPA